MIVRISIPLRCPRCDAFDAWELEGGRLEDLGFGLFAWRERCGVCLAPWQVPLPPVVVAGDVVERDL